MARDRWNDDPRWDDERRDDDRRDDDRDRRWDDDRRDDRDRRWDDERRDDDRDRRDNDDREYGPRAGPAPKTYLTEAILVVLFCCMPFGIAAIVNAASVQGYWYGQQYRLAERASSQARLWCWVGFGLGLVFNVIYITIQVMVEMKNQR